MALLLHLGEEVSLLNVSREGVTRWEVVWIVLAVNSALAVLVALALDVIDALKNL